MAVMPLHPLHFVGGRMPWHGHDYPGAHRFFQAIAYPAVHGWTREGGVDLYIRAWFDEVGTHPRNPTGNPGGWWERWNVPELKARFAFMDMALYYGGHFVDEGWFDDLRPYDEADQGKAQGKGKASGNAPEVNLKGKGKSKGKGKGKGKGKSKGKGKGKAKSKGKGKGQAKSKGKGQSQEGQTQEG